MQEKIHVVVLAGGPSSEHKVSLRTAEVIMKNLNSERYVITKVIIPKDGVIELPNIRIDVVFIAMHGAWGEDGVIQGFLEAKGIPYTGSGIGASALAMDKIRSLELFSFHGLSVPSFTTISLVEYRKNPDKVIEIILPTFSFPFVVKPSNGGSSVGVSIVYDKESISRALELAFLESNFVLLQDYIKGIETTCAVLDEGVEKPIALPPTQIIPRNSDFFDYNAKYTPGASEEITPPRLPDTTIASIQSCALRAHAILGCSGMSRSDMIVSNDTIYILETNTIPGMTETSLYPQVARAIGVLFPELLEKILHTALIRFKK